MAWTLYKEIKYDTAGIPAENLTDFPKLVSIVTDADIASELSSGGGVKFTSPDGLTDLDFGLYPATNLAAGTVLARVKVTLLTAANVGDVICRLYYSSAESTTEDKAGTVSNNYALFMPLEEDPSGSAPQMRDWVTDTLLGTSAGSMTSGDLVAGTVGNQLDFDGSDDQISGTMAANSIQSNNAFTVEGIYTIAGTDLEGLFQLNGNANQCYADKRAGSPPDNIVFSVRAGFGGPSLSVNGDIDESAHAWAFRYNGSDMSIFKDGASYGSSSITFTLPAAEAAFVVAPNAFARMQGRVDEFRISEVYRSANWLAFAYTDDFTNSDTFTLSTEQGGGGGSSVLADYDEGLVASEAFTCLVIKHGSISDTLNLSDTLTNLADLIATLSETLELSDSKTVIADLLSSTTDTIELSDTETDLRIIHGPNTEGLELSDTNDERADLLSSTTETVELSDHYSTSGGIPASISDTIELGETFDEQADLNADVSETIEVSDANTEQATLNSDTSDGIELGDTYTNTANLTSSLTETIELSDAYTKLLNGIAVISEGLEVTDTYSVIIAGDFIPAPFYYTTLLSGVTI